MNLGLESETLEFKKSTSEINEAMDDICSMLNKHGYGTLYFGVNPNGEVIGQEVSASTLDDVAKTIKQAIKPMIYAEIEKHDLNEKFSYIEVKIKGTERPYSSFGRYYKRVVDRAEEMTPSELRNVMFDTDYTSHWENNLTNFTIDDVDDITLRNFYDKAVSSGRLESLDVYNKLDLLTILDVIRDNKLTNAGYVLFSNKKPVVLKMAIYMTDERIKFTDMVRLQDNIYNLIDQGISYINRHIDWKVELSQDGITRDEIPEIPTESIREIVVNSFAHANYRGDTEHEISITPSEIEIYNPGEFLTNYTPLDYASRRIPSVPRNKKILDILFKSKNVEIQGSGLRKTYKQCDKFNIKTEYRFTDFGFSFVFKRNNSNVTVNVTQNVTAKKISSEDQILNILKINPYATREMISKEINKTVRTVQRALNILRDNNKIERVGTDKVGYWKINN
jgi:ATP-dependent DNA helicase RecG